MMANPASTRHPLLEAANLAAPAVVDRVGSRSLVIGAVAVVVSALGALWHPHHFFRAYLLAFMLWLGITLGCLALLMLQHLSGGRWGLIIRRAAEAATRNVPLMALLFVPILFGLRELYEWARPEAVAADPLLQLKQRYLNPVFFTARAVVYFACWWALSAVLNHWSAKEDRHTHMHERVLRAQFQNFSGGGLVLYGLTITFASIDWVMSLDARWFSTIYGVLFIGGQGLSAMAFLTAIVVLLARYEPMSNFVTPERLHDLGKLMLAFVMLWAYFNFSQFLIIWSGNLTEEIPWYLDRLKGGWQFIGLGLVLLHFVLPFLMLLSRDVKRHARALAGVAALIILLRLVDLFYLVAPNFPDRKGNLGVDLLDISLPLAMGGLWLWAFFRQLKKMPMLPLNDPQLPQLVEEAAD